MQLRVHRFNTQFVHKISLHLSRLRVEDPDSFEKPDSQQNAFNINSITKHLSWSSLPRPWSPVRHARRRPEARTHAHTYLSSTLVPDPWRRKAGAMCGHQAPAMGHGGGDVWTSSTLHGPWCTSSTIHGDNKRGAMRRHQDGKMGSRCFKSLWRI